MATAFPVTRPAPGIIFSVTPRSDSWIGEHLVAAGHTVIHLADGGAAVRRAVDEDVDLVIVAADLPDDAALAICEAIRMQGGGDRPIVVESAVALPPARRLAYMHAGAWECISPEDPRLAEQLLRVDACLRFRRATARERLGVLADPGTGLYNRLGLSRRAQELGAQIFRTHDFVACVVFAIGLDPDTEPAMIRCARAFLDEGRLSDIVARLGDRELAILAPRTDADGAVRLAERMARAIRNRLPTPESGGPRLELRAAFDAVSSYGLVPLRPIDLVVQAALSLRSRDRGDSTQWIRRSGGHSRPPEVTS